MKYGIYKYRILKVYLDLFIRYHTFKTVDKQSMMIIWVKVLLIQIRTQVHSKYLTLTLINCSFIESVFQHFI